MVRLAVAIVGLGLLLVGHVDGVTAVFAWWLVVVALAGELIGSVAHVRNRRRGSR